MPWFIPVAIAYFTYRAIKAATDTPSPAPVLPPTPHQPEPLISLVGKTSAGKSALGNRLLGRTVFAVGPEHGTTTAVETVPYRGSYRLRDTMGLLDAGSPDPVMMCRPAEVVIFVATGQLLRQELDALCAIVQWQRYQESLGARQRSTILFCNKDDLRRASMPDAEAAQVERLLREQVQGLVSSQHVVFGSATRPYDPGFTRLTQLIDVALKLQPLTSA